MKLLEASVKAATDQKTAGSPEPVSVADAKKERAERSPRSAASKAPARKAASKTAATPAAASDEAEDARPVRRRKSA
jgi:hypothetical protein